MYIHTAVLIPVVYAQNKVIYGDDNLILHTNSVSKKQVYSTVTSHDVMEKASDLYFHIVMYTIEK